MQQTRYSSLLIVIHWLMAVAIIGMLTSGFLMSGTILDNSLKFKLYQLHKSTGVLLLIAILARIVVRLFSVTPDLPGSISKIEKCLAKTGHLLLYILMIIMPISGWIMVSSSVYGYPTMVYDLFRWPHIQDLVNINIAANKEISSMANNIHYIAAICLVGMLVLHVGAVFIHFFKDRTNILKRIWWSE